MAGATKYVDNVLGSNANPGNAPGAGNAYATIAYAVSQISGGGNTIYVRNTGTDYPFTAAVVITVSGDATDGRNRLEGYTTTPGARDGRPTVTSATSSVNLFNLNNGAGLWDFVHLNATHTASPSGPFLGTSGTGVQSSVLIEDCFVDGCSYRVLCPGRPISGLSVRFSTARNCTTGVIANGSGIDTIEGCLFYNNAGVGYSAQNYNTSLVLLDTIIAGGHESGFGRERRVRAIVRAVDRGVRSVRAIRVPDRAGKRHLDMDRLFEPEQRPLLDRRLLLEPPGRSR